MTQTSSRQIRVFISSTFRDMQAERDYLVKFIFPQLRKLCEARSVTWGEVDLRWGITDEQSAEGQVLPICLAEIERSRPYFIGLLGERYGWIPDAIDPELIAQEPWLEQHLDHSVTELEILHGVLNNPQMAQNALFYFRDPAYIDSLDESEQADFIEVPWRSDIEAYGMTEAQKRVKQRQEKLSNLKDRIRQSGLPLRENYQSPQQLGEWVLEDLTRIINQRFPEEDKPDPLSRENALHEAFAQSRARLYIGGEQYYAALDQHVTQSNLPLVLLGDSGSGKSALLANWALRYQKEYPESFILSHFIGATPSSADLTSILLRIMRLLKQRFDLPGELPENDQQIRSDFTNWLAMAATKGKLILILDGLNQLDNRDSAQELDWLPLELPENLTIFLSTLPCRALDVIQERDWPSLTVLPLSTQERAQLIRQYLGFYSKGLSELRVQRIIEDPQSENPLALRLLLDELRQFGNHEALDDLINQYLAADSLPEMFQLKLGRLEADFENDQPGLVRRALSMLWAARFGLSEVELLEVLGEPDQPLPGRFWSPLSLALESSLVNRDGLLSFYHDYLRQAVEERYLKDEQSQTNAHLTLADYFDRQKEITERKLDELPWQLSKAKDWQRLYESLADLNVLVTLFYYGKTDLMTYWAMVETNSVLNRIQAYQSVLDNSNTIQPHILTWLSIVFMESGYLKEAMILLKAQECICREKNDLDGLQASLGNQANILYYWGNLEEAMALHKETERFFRQTDNLNGLQVSLGNQAIILNQWDNPEEAMLLLKETEQICRKLGVLEGLSRSLGNQAKIFFKWKKYEESMILHKEAERIFRQLGNLSGLSISFDNQARILEIWNQFEEAMALYKEQERICRQLGYLDGLSRSLGSQANILYKWGNLKESMALHKAAERIFRHLGNQDDLLTSLANQALILKHWNKIEDAFALYKEEERICRELNDLNRLQNSLNNQGNILFGWGKFEEALNMHKEQERVCRQLRVLDGLFTSLNNQAIILNELGRLEETMALHKEGEQICRQLCNLNWLQLSMDGQANILYKWGKLEEAMALYKEEEHICRQIGSLDWLAYCLGRQATILRDWDRLDEAMALHMEIEKIYRHLGNKRGQCISLTNQASIHAVQGDKLQAKEIFNKALHLVNEHDFSDLKKIVEARMSKLG
ncbi:MAG TPA: DUF4062 domain-containing protein [Anaerolineaceae bacterium]|nr:DUF4062 domain-containing protein [Anaerolineaceae bacterium]